MVVGMNNEIKEIVVDNDELIAYYKDGSFQTFDTLSKEVLDYINNLQESEAYYYGQYKDYKSRNEKAVEYIKKHRGMYFPSGCGDVINYVLLEFKQDYYKNGSTFTKTENLLDILNGRSAE